MMPIQPGDVAATYANIDDLVNQVGYRPNTPIAEGIRQFVAWYRDYTK
jgi:UDP-glucuronate 4-epimerase